MVRHYFVFSLSVLGLVFLPTTSQAQDKPVPTDKAKSKPPAKSSVTAPPWVGAQPGVKSDVTAPPAKGPTTSPAPVIPVFSRTTLKQLKRS